MGYSLRNQAISFTVRGTLRVLPFLPSVDLDVLTFKLPPVRLTVFSATFLPDAVALDAAFLAAAFALVVVFLAAVLALVAVFFAAALALVAAFLATAVLEGFLESAFLAGDFLETADNNLFEITALNPALINPF